MKTKRTQLMYTQIAREIKHIKHQRRSNIINHLSYVLIMENQTKTENKPNDGKNGK